MGKLSKDKVKGISQAKFPDKYSDLIELAIKDIQLCKKDKRYEIDMTEWHTYSLFTDICSVCLVGSVLAKTLGADRVTEIPWRDYPKILHDKIHFLNELKYGNIHIGDIPTLSVKLDKLLTDLSLNPIETYPTQIQFKTLIAIAKELHKAGY